MCLALASCKSGGSESDRMPLQLIPPEFRVRQVSGQMLPMRRVEPSSVSLQIDIFNRSSEPILLKRLQLQSLIGGAYRFPVTTRLFNTTIAPDGVQTVDMWVDAVVETDMRNETAPVQVRGTAIFDSPVGNFRRVFIVRVIEHGRSGIE